MSNPSCKSFDASPVKMEAPKELPKVSLVNESLKKLKFYLAKFNNVVKIKTTPDARTEVYKQCLEIAKKELLMENDRLLQQNMSQDVLLTVMNSMSLNGEIVNMERKRNESCDKCFNLDAEFFKTQNAHNDLLKNESCDNQNGLEILEYFENNDLKAQLQDKDTTIYLDPLAPRLLQNREAHIDYLKYTQEQADIIQGILEQAKSKQPLDNALDFACKHAQRIQELLVYVQDTSPNANSGVTGICSKRIEVFY
ncbi:hypothetical protein Tco_1325141 [Tanacetum coccineum]